MSDRTTRQGPSAADDRKAAIRLAILDGPVLRILLRLALPTIAVLVAQTLVGIIETYYVSRLGTDALVGVSVFFPVWMLMTMMSAGGLGGGVASAVARAIGADRHKDADDHVLNAIMLGSAMGLLFMAGIWLLGPRLFEGLGARGGALAEAVTYSRWLSFSAVPIWVVNLCSAALRGAGNVKTPALISLMGVVILIPLSPILIFGAGPLQGLGIAGAGLAVTIYYSAASVILLRYLRTGNAGLTLTMQKLRPALLRDVLRVGLIASVAVIQINLSVIIVTGTVGRFGEAAIGGYGIGARLDYLFIPLLFGLGSAMLTMIGTCIGSGQLPRAKRIAMIGTILSAAFTGGMGLIVAVNPTLWLGIFSDDLAVIQDGSTYLQVAGLSYPAMAVAFVLSFVSQGSGRPGWTTFAGTVRLGIAAGIGWLSVAHWDADLRALSAIIALSQVAAAGICLWAACCGHIWPHMGRPTASPGSKEMGA
jgi:putative MATE family efflux protein